MGEGLFVYDSFMNKKLPVSMDAESYKTYLSLLRVEENANGVEDIEAFRHRNDYYAYGYLTRKGAIVYPIPVSPSSVLSALETVPEADGVAYFDMTGRSMT